MKHCKMLSKDQKEQLEIVDINFSFHHQQLKIVKLLEKRGPIIDKLDASEKKEDSLNDLEKID